MLLFFFPQGATFPLRQKVKYALDVTWPDICTNSNHFLSSSCFSVWLKGCLTGLVSLFGSQLYYQYVSSFGILHYPAYVLQQACHKLSIWLIGTLENGS
jgi:hypothetical protein